MPRAVAPPRSSITIILFSPQPIRKLNIKDRFWLYVVVRDRNLFGIYHIATLQQGVLMQINTSPLFSSHLFSILLRTRPGSLLLMDARPVPSLTVDLGLELARKWPSLWLESHHLQPREPLRLFSLEFDNHRVPVPAWGGIKFAHQLGDRPPQSIPINPLAPLHPTSAVIWSPSDCCSSATDAETASSRLAP